MKNRYQITVIRKNDKKQKLDYHKFLESYLDAYFQQTLEWSNIITDLGNDELVLIIAKDENRRIVGAIPLFIFRSPYGSIINSVPYPGPLGGVAISSDQHDRKIVFSQLMKSVDDLAEKEHCLTTTIISSPFTPDHELYRKYWKPDWELENYTLFIDLTKPIKSTSHFRNNLNRMIKKATKNRLTIKKTTNSKDFNQWYKLHINRHTQLGLEPIPKKLLEGFFNHLISDKGLFFVVKNGSQVEAGCFVAYHKNILDTYIYSGNPEAYKSGAVYLLIDHIIKWAKNEGFKIFNWQSSKPRGGGPYNFKMQWGSKEIPYYFFTKKHGDITPLIKVGLDRIKEEYKWHFVLPYSVYDA